MATKDDDSTSEEGEFEVVEVDSLPADSQTASETPKIVEKEQKSVESVNSDPDEDDSDDEDDEDSEDSRLAERDPEDQDSPERRKRLRQRERRKEAKNRTLAENAELRRTVADLNRRLSSVETTTLATGEAQVESRLSEVRKDIATAEIVLARAIADGNGDDAAQAIRLRDEAKDQERELARAKEAFSKRETTTTETSQAVIYAGQFRSANPWYNTAGTDPASALVNAIDSGMVAEGFDPNQYGYWQELTRRVKERTAAAPRTETTTTRTEDRGPKKGPQLGSGREHAPASTRREVHVTPERKQAMIEAGYWDDPVERNKMLKAYADFDREQSAR